MSRATVVARWSIRGVLVLAMFVGLMVAFAAVLVVAWFSMPIVVFGYVVIAFGLLLVVLRR